MKSIAMVAAAAVLSGCAVSTTPFDSTQLAAAAAKDLQMMFPANQAVTEELDLEEVLERAMLNNLNTRLGMLESSYSSSQLRVDNLEMLPSLAASAGYSRSTDDGFATSQILGQSGTTGAFSRGSSNETSTGDITVTWNVLDFVLGYYNAKQSADRALIAQERQRQAALDLLRNAKGAFWRAYASQELEEQVSQAIQEADATLIRIKQGQESGAIPATVALGQQRSVLESLRQLEVLAQDLRVARVELAEMINVRPGVVVNFDSANMVTPDIDMSLEELEKLAFQNSPALREQLYRSRISGAEVSAIKASLMPSASVRVGEAFSSDEFKLQDQWTQVGMNVGLNLMQLATAPQRIELAELGTEVEEARNLAVRMAVMAQTNLAYHNFRFAKQQFERATSLYEVETAIAQQTLARGQASAASGVEMVASKTSEIMSNVRRFQAYSDLVLAHETLNTTTGMDSEIGAIADKLDQKRLSTLANITSLETQLGELHQAETDLNTQVAAIDMDIARLANRESRLRNQSDAVKAMISRAQQRQSDLQQTLLNADNLASSSDFNDLNELQTAEKQLPQLAERIKQLNEQVAQQNQQLTELASSQMALGFDKDGMSSQIAEIQVQIADTEADLVSEQDKLDYYTGI